MTQKKLFMGNALITLLFWMFFIVVSQLPQISILLQLLFIRPELFSQIHFETLSQHGLFLSVATIIQTPIVLLLGFLFVKYRYKESLARHVALNRFKTAQLVFFGLCIFLYVVCLSALMMYFQQTQALEWIRSAWQTAQIPALMLFSVIIVAPINEEFLYRGILFAGFSRSRLGPYGAIVLTALLWACVHFQYRFTDMVIIFVGGLILGLARYKSNSLYIPLIMHMIWNVTVMADFFFIAS